MFVKFGYGQTRKLFTENVNELQSEHIMQLVCDIYFSYIPHLVHSLVNETFVSVMTCSAGKLLLAYSNWD